jgi:hypothetical protein
MRHIDSDELVTALTKMVQIKGSDFIYRDPFGGHTQCQYVHLDGDSRERTYVPGCGIGQVLYDLDVISLENIFEGFHNDDDSGSFLSHLARVNEVHFSEEAADVVATFQLHQDHGDTWGESLKYALGGRSFRSSECKK